MKDGLEEEVGESESHYFLCEGSRRMHGCACVFKITDWIRAWIFHIQV